MWNLFLEDGIVNLQIDDGEKQPVKFMREGKYLKEIEILLVSMCTVIVNLEDYIGKDNGSSPTGRRKFVSIWKDHFTSCTWPDKISSRSRLSFSDSSDDLDPCLLDEEPSTFEHHEQANEDHLIAGHQDIFLKDQYRGTHPVHIMNLIAPKPDHRSRVLDMDHVSQLVHSFRENDMGQLVILVGLIDRAQSPSALKEAGTATVECLGGNHTREALRTLFEEGTLSYCHVQVRLYSNLTREAALSLGYAHNSITHEKRKVVTFMDKVRLMRDLLPDQQTPANIRVWKSALALIFKKKDGRQLQKQFAHHLMMARFPNHVWETLIHAVTGIKITERFFMPLMRLKEPYIEQALMALQNGESAYRSEVKTLLKDEEKLRNKPKQKQPKAEKEALALMDISVNVTDDQPGHTTEAEHVEEIESILVESLKKQIADLKDENKALQSENDLLKAERTELQIKLKDAVAYPRKRKSSSLMTSPEAKKSVETYKAKQMVWAKFTDGVSYPAKILEVTENGFLVKWIEDGIQATLGQEDLKPYV